MSPSIYDDSVTIDRAYFDTLLRRAQSGNGPADLNGGGRPSVVISQDEYDNLKSIASKYANLKRNLIRGGVTDETVELLSKSDESMQADAKQAVASEAPSRADPTEDGGVSLNWSSPPTSPQRSLDQSKVGQSRATPSSFSRENSQSYSHGEGQRFLRYNPKNPGFTWAGGEEDEEVADDDDYNDGAVNQENIHIPGANYAQPGNNRQQFERECVRTLQIMNLPEGTTHADVVGAVRGGQLLDVYLRTHERAVSVSFVHSADARNFLEYTRRNDLYIRNKRVNVKLNDRQFILPWHVARKIATGASRNLALVGYDSRHTEAIIREDLDHIHNLSIVKIEFIGGTCSISLNSVHNAIFARTCMMSRVRYKGKSIQFEADECAQPYPTRKAKGAVQPRKPLQTVTNRFHLLGCDEEEEEDDVQNVFQSKKSTMVAA